MKEMEFERTLRSLVRAEPFHPFTVELVEGRTIHVREPQQIAFSGGSAAAVSDDDLVFFFNDDVVRLEVMPRNRQGD